MKKVIINNVEYELEQHDNGKKLSEIKIPKGKRLLLPSEAMMLYEKGLLDSSSWFFVKQTSEEEENSSWFFVKQTSEEEEKKGNVAGFDAYSGWAFLGCSGVPSFASSSLGVIFARDVKKGEPKS